jgi:hypothetical protein
MLLEMNDLNGATDLLLLYGKMNLIESPFPCLGDIKLHLQHTMVVCYENIRKIHLQQFHSCLKSIGWPKVESSKLQQTNFVQLVVTLAKFPTLSALKNGSGIALENEVPEVFKAFVEEIHIQFSYHFRGKRKTNQIRKPEYYLDFILQTISDQKPFFDYVQTIFDHSKISCNAFFEFISACLALIEKKVTKDLSKLFSIPNLFIHTICELTKFENQLRQLYTYRPRSLLKPQWDGISGIILNNENNFDFLIKSVISSMFVLI